MCNGKRDIFAVGYSKFPKINYESQACRTEECTGFVTRNAGTPPRKAAELNPIL